MRASPVPFVDRSRCYCFLLGYLRRGARVLCVWRLRRCAWLGVGLCGIGSGRWRACCQRDFPRPRILAGSHYIFKSSPNLVTCAAKSVFSLSLPLSLLLAFEAQLELLVWSSTSCLNNSKSSSCSFKLWWISALSSTRASPSSRFEGLEPGVEGSFERRVISCCVCFRESKRGVRRAWSACAFIAELWEAGWEGERTAEMTVFAGANLLISEFDQASSRAFKNNSNCAKEET